MDAKITVITRGKVVGQQAVGGRPPRYASVPCKLTISSYLFTRWHLFRHVGYLRHPCHSCPLTFWPWNWCPESSVLPLTYANFLVFLGLSVLELGPMYAARWRGTHCQHTFVVWRTAPLHLDDYLRLICFPSTSVYSASGVSAIMRYINRRFTYLLTDRQTSDKSVA